MEKLGFIIPRLLMGVLVQVLCSYSTLPLYALVTQMGSMFKQGIIDEHVNELLAKWAEGGRRRGTGNKWSVVNRMGVNDLRENNCLRVLTPFKHRFLELANE